MAAISYDLAGRHFATQTELERTVKEHLKICPRNTPFRSLLLEAIVNELHPEVLASPHRSTGKFRILTWQEQERMGMDTAKQFRGGVLVETYFEPLGRWQDVTVYPWRQTSHKVAIKNALRLKVNMMGLIPLPDNDARCAETGCTYAGFDLEYHHLSPTFDEMVNKAMEMVTPEEIDTRFGYDKFAEGKCSEADFIPDDHPAVLMLREMHQDNEWVWLCPFHHRGAAA